MGDDAGAERVDAAWRLRPGRAARRRGDRHPRSLPLTEVRLYHAEGCSLCDRARAQVERLRAELGFDYAEVDITGVEELEAAYREWLPVVEIDGERAFVYFLDEPAFRRKLSQAT